MAKRKTSGKSTGPAETARRIWLAGLGALATAEEEGGKLFDGLVKRGRGVERSLAEPIEGATRRVRSTLGDVRSRAGRAIGQVERAVDDGVNATLERVRTTRVATSTSARSRCHRIRPVSGSSRVTTPKWSTTATAWSSTAGSIASSNDAGTVVCHCRAPVARSRASTRA